MSELGVRRAKAALSGGCKPHPTTAPAGSNRSSHGGKFSVHTAATFGLRPFMGGSVKMCRAVAANPDYFARVGRLNRLNSES